MLLTRRGQLSSAYKLACEVGHVYPHTEKEFDWEQLRQTVVDVRDGKMTMSSSNGRIHEGSYYCPPSVDKHSMQQWTRNSWWNDSKYPAMAEEAGIVATLRTFLAEVDVNDEKLKLKLTSPPIEDT